MNPQSKIPLPFLHSGHIHQGISLIDQRILPMTNHNSRNWATHWHRLVAKGIGSKAEGLALLNSFSKLD